MARQIEHSATASKAKLLCVPPADVRAFWPHVAPLLKQAIERTNLCRFQDIEDDVLDGDGLLWLAWSGKIDAAATTSLQQMEDGLVCVLSTCGGANMNNWLPLLKKIEAYAKDEGCTALRIFGRAGWQRVLEGYEVTNVVLEKGLA